MFGNHGLGGLLEKGAHGKSPKCLDGNLGDFGEFCKGLNPPKTIVDAFIVAVCRFDQGAAVEGAGVGFLKNSVLNIPFQMKERSSDVFQTTFLPFKAEAVLQMERNAETSDKFQDVFLRLVTLFLLKWEGHRHLYPLRRQYPSRHFFFDFDRL